MRSDPNGYDWRALGYSSLEAFIESKAGANPPDPQGWGPPFHTSDLERCRWPVPKPPPFAADDEDDPAPRGDAE